MKNKEAKPRGKKRKKAKVELFELWRKRLEAVVAAT